jgi:hypothetical protein
MPQPLSRTIYSAGNKRVNRNLTKLTAIHEYGEAMTGLYRIRPGTPAFLTTCLLLTLAGCGVLDKLGAPPPPEAASTPTTEALPSPPPRKPNPPAATTARLPPQTPTPEANDVDQLIGLDQPQVASLLGEPRTRAESPPATIWRYGGPNCEVDVYFYLDLQSQTMRALHYEVRSHDAPERSAQRCYNALLSERRTHADSNAGSDRPR